MENESVVEGAIPTLERPEPTLLAYYFVLSLVAGPFFFVPFLFLYFRYRSLTYRFDEEGVSMAWGVLSRREIHLTYSRIQDIHLVSNAVERWLGLGRIKVQTASGSAKAEMTIEGSPAFRELRDFLYSQMRGARNAGPDRQPTGEAEASNQVPEQDELAATLYAVAEELERLRLALDHSEERSEQTDRTADV